MSGASAPTGPGAAAGAGSGAATPPPPPHPPHPPPLAGVRVLDLTRYLPGPFCTQLLGDFGAEVIKVEDTGLGDPVRLAPPAVEGPAGASLGAPFLFLNRNKQSVAVDLKRPEGRQLLLGLAERADVVVEGFRPGVMERLGLGFEALRARNRGLVYCAITGYGQDGPLRDQAGHDLNYTGLTGALELTGEPGAARGPLGVQVADLAGALYGAIGVLLALAARRATGEGQLVDVSMHEAALSLLAVQCAQALYGQEPARGRHALAGGLANYGVYETRDARHLAIGALEPHFWERACQVLDLPDLAPEAGRALLLGDADPAAAEVARARVGARVRERTLAEWLDAFAGVDACVSPVLGVGEALEHPHLRARGARRALAHDALGLVHQLAPAVRLSATPAALERGAPLHGADTAGVLARVLGLGAAEVEALRQAGVVR